MNKIDIPLIEKLFSIKFTKWDNTEGGCTGIFYFETESGYETVRFQRFFLEHLTIKYSNIIVLNSKIKTLLK